MVETSDQIPPRDPCGMAHVSEKPKTYCGILNRVAGSGRVFYWVINDVDDNYNVAR